MLQPHNWRAEGDLARRETRGHHSVGGRVAHQERVHRQR